MARKSKLNRRPVESIVRDIVGRERSRGLPTREIDRLVKGFVDAGRDAVELEFATAGKAARLICNARRGLGRARKQLAAATATGHPDVFVERSWRRTVQALEVNRDHLLKYPGVVGLKPGYRMRGREETREQCIAVLVVRKWSRERLRKRAHRILPRSVSDGKGGRIAVDVVEIGRLNRQVRAGSSIGPLVANPPAGTLGAFARERGTGRPVALTAMHVAGANRTIYPTTAAPEIAETTPSRKRDSSAPVFGRLLRGTMRGTDAAAILLAPDQKREPSPIGPVRGWRPMIVPGDKGTRVRMFGAKSGFLVGSVTDPFVSLPQEPYSLDVAFIVEIDSQDGDSGAAVVDDEDLLLGFLVGAAPRFGASARLFAPVSAVLTALGCEIP